MRVINTLTVNGHRCGFGAKRRSTFSARALTTVSALALAAFAVPHATYAAEAAQAAQNQSGQTELEELVITGSRIVREGYEAPTPLAVISVEAIQGASNNNVAEFLQTMPVFTGNMSPATNQAGISAGTAGVNTLNLRGLGAARSLILLDGQRSVGSLLNQNVDVNNFPQQLIQRVDVVTGGASAVYGSDAVAGVANFILDKQFTGIKGELSGGVTSYGDDRSYKVAVSAGFGFANDRGHVLLSGEHTTKDGIIEGAGGYGKRKWDEQGWGTMVNPNYTATNGQPRNLVLNHLGQSNATKGGIITTGPLKGTAFGPGGIPYQFNYGPLVLDPYMQGGDWFSTLVHLDRGNSLDPGESRQNVFTRVAYDVTDDINVFVSASWGRSYNLDQCCTQFQQGNAANNSNAIPNAIKADNAFIPAEIRARMTALNLTTLTMGSMNYDLPSFGANSDRYVNRYVVGASGKFDAFGTGWTWDAYFQNGKGRNSVNTYGVGARSKFALATDAVRNPATGAIVCRVKLTNPTNACQPYNLFGEGVNTQAAINYIIGDSHMNADLVQNVWAASVTGEPFSVPAGPVSVAFSAEHRTEKTFGVSDPGSVATDWFAGNYKAIIGDYSVTEGAVETVVPLAHGESWADSWDLNAAARATDYSTSGFVVTWKVGTTYSPVPDVKLRVTRSRDIRAPNLQELYAVGTSSQGTQTDPFCIAGPKQVPGATCTPLVRGVAVGNQDLGPEKADTTGIGVVVQPTFLPGFSASVDYWNININDAIGSSGSPLNLCFNDNLFFCQFVHRVNGVLVETITTSVNLASSITRGIDFEGTYRWAAEDMMEGLAGNLSLHANASMYLKDYTDTGIPGSTPTDAVGGPTQRDWRFTGTLSYDLDPIRASLTARAIPAGKISTSGIECTSGCPPFTTAVPTYNYNRVPSAYWFDASLSYKFMIGESAQSEAFFNVRNLLNRDPGVIPAGAFYYAHPTNQGVYDALGRIFRAGLRFKM